MPQTSSLLFVLVMKANLICLPSRGDTSLFKKREAINGNLIHFGSVHKDILIKAQNYFRSVSFPLFFLEQLFLCVFRYIHLCTLDGWSMSRNNVILIWSSTAWGDKNGSGDESTAVMRAYLIVKTWSWYINFLKIQVKLSSFLVWKTFEVMEIKPVGLLVWA